MRNDEKLQFHLLDGNGRPCGVFDYAIQEFIKEKHKLFILAGTPYFYENGAYKIDKSGTRLKTLIKGCILPRFIKSTTITRIYQLFLQDYELEKNYEEINQFPEYWIPFKDCMYDVKTEERLSHKPEYYCINQIPWNFPEGESIGVETEKFLSSAMNAEDRKTIFQYLGLCMTRLNFQKFLILKGSRGTGKSVVIHMFESVIGTGNYSNVPLQKLEEKFYSIQLLGKLLNLCADINASPLKTVNSIKLITGGDTLSDSFKGKDIITFAPYTGKLTGLEKGYFGNDGESMSIKVYAEGTFLNNYERQYEKQTIEDVRISHISKEDFSALEAEKKKKAENQPVELINVDKVNIGAKPANSDSPAAKYTKAYSARMSTVNPEFE